VSISSVTSTSPGCNPNWSGDDLRQHRLVALALHGDVGGRPKPQPSGSTLTVTIEVAPFFGPAFSRVFGVSKVER
jgi:hypothetical protein